MFRFFQNTKLSLDSLLNLITDLVADGLLFFRLLFRSRTALSAEVLFLRKQLAFYQERQVQPRRLNDSARFSLILWSRLCNWKEALVIVKPETLIGWHRKSFQLFGKWKSQAGRPRIPENIRNLCPCRKCYPSRMPLKSATTSATHAHLATMLHALWAGEITIRQPQVKILNALEVERYGLTLPLPPRKYTQENSPRF